MAPNLTLDVLALHDKLQEGGSSIATTKAQQHHQPVCARIDSDSYWDWPADVHEAAQPVVDGNKSSDAGTLTTDDKEKTSTTFCNDDLYWAERTYEEDIDTKFFINYSREMGRGKGTVVRKAIERKTGQRFAVKSCSKRQCKEEDVQHEAAMLLSCDGHSNILRCFGTYQDSNNLHIVTEYASGGELYDFVIQRAKKNLPRHKPSLTEPEAAYILQQLLSAVVHCHSKGIVHRDLKLENLMIADRKKKNNKSDNQLDIKVIDFGLAARIPRKDQFLLQDRVGTNYYVAPEVLKGSGYNQVVDVWSLGVIAYTLLSAMPPFRGVTEEETYDFIRSQEVQFEGKVWEQVSTPAKEFIQACLQKDQRQRPSAEDLLQHDWIIRQQQQQSLSQASSSASKRSNHRFLQKFKKAFHLS